MTRDNAALALVILGLALAGVAVAGFVVGTGALVLWLAQSETGQFVLLVAAALVALAAVEGTK
jgi:hypothetical protein